MPTEGAARRLREHDFGYVRTGGRGGGFSPFRDGSTLSGVPPYRARGYVELERMGVPLANGESLPIVHWEMGEETKRQVIVSAGPVYTGFGATSRSAHWCGFDGPSGPFPKFGSELRLVLSSTRGRAVQRTPCVLMSAGRLFFDCLHRRMDRPVPQWRDYRVS